MVKRKAKKTWKRKPKSRIPRKTSNTFSEYRVALMAWQPVLQNGLGTGGFADANYNYAMNFPTYGLSSSVGGTYGQLANVAQEYTRAFAMFDEYRVEGIEIRFIPSELDVKLSTTTAVPDVGDYPSIIYCYRDMDDVTGVPTEASMLSAGTYPVQNSYEKVVKYKFKNTTKGWMNTGSITLQPGSNLTGGTDVIGSETFSSVKVYFPRQQYPGAGSAYYFGRIYAKWDVVFRGVKLN